MTKFEGIKMAFEAAKIVRNFDRQISANTRVSVYDGKINVRLHNTNVFTYNTNSGAVVLRFGGYYTNTTRNTINTAFAACGLDYSLSFAKCRVSINGVNIELNDAFNYRFSVAA